MMCTGSVEPPEPKYDPRAARGGESVRIRLRRQVAACHREQIRRDVLVDPFGTSVGVQHADGFLDDTADIGSSRSGDHGG